MSSLSPRWLASSGGHLTPELQEFHAFLPPVSAWCVSGISFKDNTGSEKLLQMRILEFYLELNDSSLC